MTNGQLTGLSPVTWPTGRLGQSGLVLARSDLVASVQKDLEKVAFFDGINCLMISALHINE